MAAHLRQIWVPKCQCGKTATLRLHNTYNAAISDYCSTCGPKALRRYRAEWEAQDVAERKRQDAAARGGGA